MAITSVGYDGSVNEQQWAQIANSLGTRDGVAGDGDWRVTAVAGLDRTVAIAVGTGYGHGVLDVSDASVNVQLPTVGSGVRWDTIVAYRNWQPPVGLTSFTYRTGTSSQAVAAGTLDNPGVESDQVLALVQITAGVQAPTAVVDMRTWPSKVVYALNIPPAARYAQGTLLLVAGVLYRRSLSGSTPVWVGENAPGWTNLTLASGYTAYSGATPLYRVTADRLELQGLIARTSGALLDDVYTTVASVPSALAPARYMYVPCGTSSVAGTGSTVGQAGGAMCRVTSAGQIQVLCDNSFASFVSLDGITIPIGA